MTKTRQKTTEEERLRKLRRDPLSAQPDDIERCIDGIRATYPEEGSNLSWLVAEAWDQLGLASEIAGRYPEETIRSLDRVYESGSAPAKSPGGFHRGMVIAPMRRGVTGLWIHKLTRMWMPWIGKRLNPDSQTGINILRSGFRLPMRAVWPKYTPQKIGNGYLAAMTFRTHIEPGLNADDQLVLRLNYDLVGNPAFLVRDIVDELVEVIPGVLLGRMFLRRKESWHPVAYFALRKDNP